MKSIINGKRYDTENAIELGESRNGSPGDWHFSCERLYKTKRSGAYFLHGKGGPRSQYATSPRPGEWTGAEKIIPMDRDEAMDWAERCGLTDLLEKEFGDQIEDA